MCCSRIWSGLICRMAVNMDDDAVRALYGEILGRLKEAKQAGVTGIVVFKPNAESDEGVSFPDMIATTADNPEIIAALLGNWPIKTDDEE